MAAYQWAKTFNADMRGVTLNHQPDAEVVGQELARIEKKAGALTPEAIVEASKPARAKCHKCFNWDNDSAAEKYRLEQARLLVRSIRVIVSLPDDGDKSIPAYSSVKNEQAQRIYVNTTDAMTSRQLQDQILQDCLNSLIQWRRKWADLAAVADAAEPIDIAIAKLRTAVAAESK